MNASHVARPLPTILILRCIYAGSIVPDQLVQMSTP